MALPGIAQALESSWHCPGLSKHPASPAGGGPKEMVTKGVARTGEGLKSADPLGLRVEPPSFLPILQTFLFSNLILLGLGSAGGISPRSSPRMFFSDFFDFGDHFGANQKSSKIHLFF